MKVQELLSSEDKWIQKSYAQRAHAKNKYGEAVLYDSSDAVKWSLTGAIWKCYFSSMKVVEIMDNIKNTTNQFVGVFNDSHSYEEVMELVRRLDL